MQKNRSFLLIVACLILGVLVFLDNWHAGEDAAPPAVRADVPAGLSDADAEEVAETNATQQAAGLQLQNPLVAFDKSKLKDWVQRPLFAPSRKRPPPVATADRPAQQLGAQPPPPSYDLLGIVRDGERAIALLRKRGEGTSFRVEVGDMIGGWRVARMETASVILERADGTSQTVPLARE